MLPPLRERPADVPPLAAHLARRIADKLGLGVVRAFGPEAVRALAAYDWPGNVRELENAVEYALIESKGPVVRREDLPPHIAGVDTDGTGRLAGVVVTEDGLSFRHAVSILERELILQSLRLAEGNKARAAELLELKRTTFLEKLRRLEQDGMISTAH